MSKATPGDIRFLRNYNIQGTPPNRTAARKLIKFIEERNYYSPPGEIEIDRVTMVIALEAIWLNRRIVITGEHHPRRGELGIVTHIQPTYDVWNGARQKWANLMTANRTIAKLVGAPLGEQIIATNFDVLELGIKLDDGNQVKGRKNVDGLYVHLARRVAED